MKRKWRTRRDLRNDYYYVEYKSLLFWHDLDIYALGVYKWCKEQGIAYYTVSADDYKSIYCFTSLDAALNVAKKAEEMMSAVEDKKIKRFIYFTDDFKIKDA